jgi:flagellar biosynthesis protein FliP|tara:strand:- start:988 stop:1197 length:210 start_codon:yes stop_codon:yes gene_type:complete
MSLLEIQERLDFLITEVYNHNISPDDARDEIEYELKDFMSKELYRLSLKQLEDLEEEMFQKDWNLVEWQ